jgi:hypothetical protein
LPASAWWGRLSGQLRCGALLVGDAMATPSTRITIRLSPLLAARLAAKAGPQGHVADTVRQALEAYLQDDPASRQPVADTLAAMADTVAAIQARLTAVERRLTALEGMADTGSQRQTPGRQAASQGAPHRTRQPRQPEPPALDAVPPFDASKFVLGKLCPRGHDYYGTGQTLRRLFRHVCPACDVERTREARKTRRAAEGATS